MIEDGVKWLPLRRRAAGHWVIRNFLIRPSDARRLVRQRAFQAARQELEQGHGNPGGTLRAACAQQPIAGRDFMPAPKPMTFGRIAGRSTLYAIRKLLP